MVELLNIQGTSLSPGWSESDLSACVSLNDVGGTHRKRKEESKEDEWAPEVLNTMRCSKKETQVVFQVQGCTRGTS